jgi:hypothetical protein
MDYGEVLSRAWRIIWRHKILWLFGILAGCTNFGGSSGNAGSGVQYEFGPEDFNNTFGQMSIPDEAWVAIAIIAVLIGLVLAVIAIFLGTIGRIALIRGTVQADRGTGSLVFGELFGGSMPYFWRVFGLAVLIFLTVLLVVVIPIIIFSIVTLGIGLICLLPLFCLLIPLSWFLMIVIEQANIAIVVENLGIMDGLRRGWEVVRANLGPMILMGLILILGVGLIGGAIIGLPLFLVVIPSALGMAAQTEGSAIAGLAITGLCVAAYLPVVLILNGILTSYTESAWTLTFLRLTGRRTALAEPAPVEA